MTVFVNTIYSWICKNLVDFGSMFGNFLLDTQEFSGLSIPIYN